MVVDDLGEHHHVEVGVADAQHVVGGVQRDVNLAGDQRGGLGRTGVASHEVDLESPVLGKALIVHHLGIYLGERRRVAHRHHRVFGWADLLDDNGVVGGAVIARVIGSTAVAGVVSHVAAGVVGSTIIGHVVAGVVTGSVVARVVGGR